MSGNGNGNGGGDERRSAKWKREREQGRGGNGNGNGDGDGNESSSGDRNGDGNEDVIGESGRETKKRKKSQNSCRRHVGNGGDLRGKRKKLRQERTGSVASDLDDLKNHEEAGRGSTRYPGLKYKLYKYPLCRV